MISESQQEPVPGGFEEMLQGTESEWHNDKNWDWQWDGSYEEGYEGTWSKSAWYDEATQDHTGPKMETVHGETGQMAHEVQTEQETWIEAGEIVAQTRYFQLCKRVNENGERVGPMWKEDCCFVLFSLCNTLYIF